MPLSEPEGLMPQKGHNRRRPVRPPSEAADIVKRDCHVSARGPIGDFRGVRGGKDLPTYRLAFSKVIISLRVTVTHLVVTGGPPPAMCQAA
jgi:hypothetical protein